ncbi:2OG-Fe(II) oxygenase [Xanthomonas phaseoli pv. dieffenbachiae]|uniref:prolyl hydroxylase family protein n=1 Tax=Xanthomonas TaxID=338 RepID=UPI0009BF9C93|nr:MULTISPECIES: 2OG-Fe(II) oxygenase [Xanthomonas]MBO9749334.1 2OG-Fe(II) oxygenase [Xanthomonas phaseoli pv. dieffenbachiae]MBO9753400.1 2OG-Fe(II) oxygenase [Xanthomonas phaseoli pv. dieffenbachiae]MBO9891590.1 2OG-Fe(II) oxygenase [Xanthomonas sp. D-36-1]
MSSPSVWPLPSEMPQSQAQPGDGLWRSHGSIVLDGRRVRLIARMRAPRLILLDDVLDPDECAALIELARPRLARSQIINTGDRAASAIASYTRTSQSTFITPQESALVAAIERRIAALLEWPVDHLEHIQVVRYGAGADFVPHHDYFDIGLSATEALLQRGGNRIGSMLLYLNVPESGGTTVFSDVEIDVVPQCGSALYFGYPHPDPSSLTLHAGAPVLAGEKWLATFFVRESLMHRRPPSEVFSACEQGSAHG